MRKIPYLFLIIFSFYLTSCTSTYRGPNKYKSGSGSFKGPGRLKTNADNNYTPYHGELRLIWPVDKARMTQQFAPPKNPKHDGIDLSWHKGSRILAAQKGKVIYSGHKYSGYGNVVIIKHNETWATLYAHLNKVFVRKNKLVDQGMVIGTMGNTGRVTGVHLHFELLKNKVPTDPLLFLKR